MEEAVNIKKTLINVTNLEKEYFNPAGEYESFYKLVDEGETDERLDTVPDLLKELICVAKNGFDKVENKQDLMIEKQGLMIVKQTETMDKIDQNRIEITSKVRSTRDDFRFHLDERISKMEFELA